MAVTVDRLRSAVYTAEDQWSTLLDRGGALDFFGSTVQVPLQVRFGSLEHARDYVESVCRANDLTVPTVRNRKGGKRAHYEQGVIAVSSDHVWAMRESVLLHEIAHHMCVVHYANFLHDDCFAETMLALVYQQLGAEAHSLLRTGYLAAGVHVKGSV